MKISLARPIHLLMVLVAMVGAGNTALHAQTYTVLYNFASQSCDPVNPSNVGAISQGRDGNLYSSTASGGCHGNGAAFKVTPKGKLTTIKSFSLGAGDGIGPVSGLTLSTDGNYWGTTEGEDFNSGSIFKMTASGTETNFSTVLGGTGQVNGGQPYAPPVEGMDGNFYGMTTSGGNSSKCTYGDGGCGVVYKITSSGKYKLIYTFDQTNGGNPDSPLLLATDGNFYGTASLGGSVGSTFLNAGVVFKITPGGKYTVLWAFCSVTHCNDGANPIAGLVQGTDGNFYGTTEYGGLGTGGYPEGVIFKITPSGKLTALYNFCSLSSCKDGANPIGGLVQATDGNFYGTTAAGGANGYGNIFQITPKGDFTDLYDFAFTTGVIPRVTLLQNTNGILYGDTVGGGTGTLVNCGGNRCGVFYSLNVGLKPFVAMVAWYGKVGKTLEILGQGLSGTTAVSFNGTAATSFKAVSNTYLTAVIPPGATPGFVTVTTPGGVLTTNRKFKVIPFIQDFTPSSGPVGTAVTINGGSFTGATKVTFGGVKATTYTVVSDIEITANVPTGAKTGRISVTAPLGTATSSANFTVTQ
jgi:uncharacterized repeat protein (TIGR03803 family)